MRYVEIEALNEEQEYLQDFIEEAKEHLENIELKLLELERDPKNKDVINSIFRSLHTLKGLAGFVAQELIEVVAHKTENIISAIRKGEINSNKKSVDAILDSVEIIKAICADIDIQNNEDYVKEVKKHIEYLEGFREGKPKIGEILKEKIGITDSDIEKMVQKQNNELKGMKLGEIAVKENLATAKEIIDVLRTQEDVEEYYEKIMSKSLGGFVKIPYDKIDEMGDMFGEIMTLYLQILQENNGSGQNMNAKYVRMEKIFKDIQENINSLRMVDFKYLFKKLSKVISECSKELGIDVEVEVLGEGCEIDRGISDKLFEPLMHLVKNCVYHGINMKLKTDYNGYEKGKLKIEAKSGRGHIYINIEDDGRGIDREAIINKGIKEGLLIKKESYGDNEIFELMFLPGFTTVESADIVSGRGFGMDIVRNELSKFGAKIEIESEKDRGTKFKIKIPLNMAVINGTIVTESGRKFIIPTIYIKEILKDDENINISCQGKKSLIKVRETIYHLIDKKNIFDNKEDDKKSLRDIIIILENENIQKAIKINNVLGRRDILIKNIGEHFSENKNILGGAILEDGNVALILDVESILNK